MYKISQFPHCGLGNKILLYNALVQTSAEMGLPFSCCYDSDLDAALDIQFPEKFEGGTEFPFELGQNFFRKYYVNFDTFLKPKNVLHQDRKSPTIAVHFRGKDYHTWKDGRGILPFEYYVMSLAECLEDIAISGPKETLFIDLHTDDVDLPAYKQFVNYIKSFKAFGMNTNITYPWFYGDDDRWAWQFMCQADYIISAPSTYSITAGAIGKQNKKIIHSQQWIDWRASEDDQFWVDLVTGKGDSKNHPYKLWRTK